MSVVKYKKYPLADENRAWDWALARKHAAEYSKNKDWNIDFSKYKEFFTWYDENKKENVTAYKLPHHDVIDWQIKTVPRWVFAAMAALLWARWWVSIPESEKKAVYNHLKKHYEEMWKEAPEFGKIYNDYELMKIENWEDLNSDKVIKFYWAILGKSKNEEKREVWWIATKEIIDSVWDIVDYKAVKEAWDDYMKFANIREMHQPKAVWTVVDYKFDDENKAVYIKAKIVDDEARLKVKEWVYKWFSIWWRVLDWKYEIVDWKEVFRITKLELIEISLVDRPANPEAVIESFKSLNLDTMGIKDLLKKFIKWEIKEEDLIKSFQEESEIEDREKITKNEEIEENKVENQWDERKENDETENREENVEEKVQKTNNVDDEESKEWVEEEIKDKENKEEVSKVEYEELKKQNKELLEKVEKLEEIIKVSIKDLESRQEKLIKAIEIIFNKNIEKIDKIEKMIQKAWRSTQQLDKKSDSKYISFADLL